LALFYQKVDFMGVGICRLMPRVRLLTGLPDTPAGRLEHRTGGSFSAAMEFQQDAVIHFSGDRISLASRDGQRCIPLEGTVRTRMSKGR
jgi:hypothetical protein